VATLASLDDPEVTAATSKLHPKKYVGFVRNVRITFFTVDANIDIMDHRRPVLTTLMPHSWLIR
jgi:hypothetical protein